MADCTAALPNTGYNACTGTDYGKVKSVILSQRRLEFATETTAKVQANMTALITAELKSHRAYPLPEVFLVEPANDEAVNDIGDLGISEQVRRTAGVDKFHINNMPKKVKNRLMAAWNNKTVYAFFIHSKNYLVGVLDEATGLKVQMEKVKVNVSEIKMTDSEYYRLTFEVQRLDVAAADNYSVAVQPSYSLLELKGLQYVTYTATPASTSPSSTFTITVATEVEGTPVTGLLVADWTLTKAGVGVALTSLTDNGDGTYLCTPTAEITTGAHDLALDTPNDITDQTLLIEGFAHATLTVVAP